MPVTRMDNQHLSLIGLAYRARKVTSGTELIVRHIQSNNTKLILLAKDCSEQTKKKLTDKCKTYNVPYIEVADRYTLGKVIGKDERVALSIDDKGFAQKLMSLLL